MGFWSLAFFLRIVRMYACTLLGALIEMHNFKHRAVPSPLVEPACLAY